MVTIVTPKRTSVRSMGGGGADSRSAGELPIDRLVGDPVAAAARIAGLMSEPNVSEVLAEIEAEEKIKLRLVRTCMSVPRYVLSL